MADSLQLSICTKAVTACFREPLSTASHLVNDLLYLYRVCTHMVSAGPSPACRRQAGPLTLPPVPDSETTLNPRSYYESVPWDRSQAQGLGYSHAIFISLQRCCSLQISMKEFSTFQNYLQSLFLVGHESAVFSLGLCFLLLAWKFKVLVAQSRLTLCNPIDCSPPGSSVCGFSSQEYWRGLSFPTPGHLPNPGIETLHLQHLSCWQANSLPLSPPGKSSSTQTEHQIG